MLDKELKELWQQTGEQAKITINEDQIVTTMQKAMSEFEGKIRKRNLAEIAAAVFVIACFGVYFVFTDAWVAKAGAGIVVGGSLLIILKLVSASRSSAKEEELMASDVHKQLLLFKQKVEQQVRLLNSVLYWYLSPLYAGLVLFTLGSRGVWFSIVFILAITFLFYRIYKMNKKACAQELLPLKKRIEQALQEMA
jgi:hypothetical protein